MRSASNKNLSLTCFLRSHQGVGRNVHDNHGTVKMPEGTHTINGQVQTQPFAAAIPKNIDEHASFRHLYTERRDGT